MSAARSTGSANGDRVTTFDDFVARLSAELNVALDGAAPEDRLVDDLGLDSIALFGLLVLLEDTAPHDLPIELIDNLETLGDVWHWYTNLAGPRAGAGDTSLRGMW